MAITIRRDNDPFKKYWWALLVLFGLGAAWVCLPALQSGGLAAGGQGEEGLMKSSGAQSLDSRNNPSGAPGGAIDASMDGAGAYAKKRTDEPATSSLYQAMETAAPGAPLSALKPGASASAPPSSLAAALKDVGNAAKKPGGWNEKAQKGFTAPHSDFGGMSGLGSGGSSGGTSASAARGAQPGVISAGGPDSSASAGGDGGTNKNLSFLKATSAASTWGAGQKALFAASDAVGRTFEGSPGAKNALTSGPAGSALAQLDASQAPINLKQDPIRKPKDAEAKKVDKKKDPKKDDKSKDDKADQEDISTSILKKVIDVITGGITSAFGKSMFGDSSSNAAANNAK